MIGSLSLMVLIFNYRGRVTSNMNQDEWRGVVDSRLTSIESRLGSTEVKSAVDEVHRVNVEKRLGAIESSLTWLVRLVVGALILGLIGFALSGGFALV